MSARVFPFSTLVLALLTVITANPALSAPGDFADSGQTLGSAAVQHYNIDLGDLDGDGDLDAFVANWRAPNRVYINLGDGNFISNGQALGTEEDSVGVALGDLDGDGDLDAYVANQSWPATPGWPDQVYLNDGRGNFTDTGQALGDEFSSGVKLADLDGDGDLDAFVVTQLGGPNKVYFNNGSGTFTDSGQGLGGGDTLYVDLGDIDGDGDIDAFTTNFTGGRDRVYSNNGFGTFSLAQVIDTDASSWGIALGDYDSDGDLDAFVSHWSTSDYVYINNGSGTFTDSGQRLGSHTGTGAATGDMDGDGDLDVFVTNHANQPNQVYFNSGTGTFSNSGQALGTDMSTWVDLGDLDGDSDLDAFVANDRTPNRVYINDGSPAVSPVVYNPASGILTLPSVQILGTVKFYQVQLTQLPGGGYLFQMTAADKIPIGAATAVFDGASGLLTIPRVEIQGTTRAYAVQMMKQPGGYIFQMTSATVLPLPPGQVIAALVP